MPQTKFSVGDFVIHDDLGKGIVCGVLEKDGQYTYHIRFVSKCHNFKYVHDNNPKPLILHQTTCDANRQAAQNLLMEHYRDSIYRDLYCWAGHTIPGDIIKHPTMGRCIVIGPDDLGFRVGKFRHIYSYTHDVYDYVDCSNYKLIKQANNDTKERVRQIWLGKILPRAYLSD